MLMQAPAGNGHTGRVVLSDGQDVSLVIEKGYATAWFQRPEGVEPDHVELDLAAGGNTWYP